MFLAYPKVARISVSFSEHFSNVMPDSSLINLPPVNTAIS
jgi:hypothetical protein